MNTGSIGQIDAAAVYSPRQLATAMGTGPQTVYTAIRVKALRAAAVNTRGDLRIVGQWALNYLEHLAVGGHDTPQPDASAGPAVAQATATPLGVTP